MWLDNTPHSACDIRSSIVKDDFEQTKLANRACARCVLWNSAEGKAYPKPRRLSTASRHDRAVSLFPQTQCEPDAEVSVGHGFTSEIELGRIEASSSPALGQSTVPPSDSDQDGPLTCLHAQQPSSVMQRLSGLETPDRPPTPCHSVCGSRLPIAPSQRSLRTLQ